eukprot:446236-Amorphochlora_amoeboformis.AAC.1
MSTVEGTDVGVGVGTVGKIERPWEMESNDEVTKGLQELWKTGAFDFDLKRAEATGSSSRSLRRENIS